VIQSKAVRIKPWPWREKKRYAILRGKDYFYTQNIEPFAKPLSNSSDVVVIKKLIKDGNGIVVPYLLNWLQKTTIINTETKKIRLLAAIRGLGLFRVREALPRLKSIYQNSNTDDYVKKNSLYAIIRINDSTQVTFLRELLLKSTLDHNTLCKIAGALVTHDIEEGRTFLLRRYKTYLEDIAYKSSWNATVREVMERIYDRKIIKELTQLQKSYPPGRVYNNISSVIARMNINNLSIDTLIEMAQETNPSKSAYKRSPAIHTLGQKADPKIIPILKNIIYEEPRYIKEAAAAIIEIQRRHWDTLSQNPK
jgi:hypothetical protein